MPLWYDEETGSETRNIRLFRHNMEYRWNNDIHKFIFFVFLFHSNRGFYCPGNLSLLECPQPCPAGYYCPTATSLLPCPKGSYCPEGSSEPTTCGILSFPCEETTSIPRYWIFLFAVLIVPIGLCGLVLFYTWLHERKRKLSKKSIISSPCLSLCMEKPSEGIHVDFDGLEYRLDPKKPPILQEVSGRCRPGKVMAVMGPSGAGKTTFLKVLSGNLEKTGGTVRINGKESSLREWKRLIGYVPQEDVMYPHLTVRETLMFQANMRLPSHRTRRQRIEHVDEIIELLGLQEVQHNLVGDPIAGNSGRNHAGGGISGGQRKRVNIGMELVAHPQLILLDEPTSGLDSTSAMGIVKVLKSIAEQKNVTIVIILHQPSAQLFRMFDDLLLLGKGGRTVYSGAMCNVPNYFARNGYECPASENPAEFYMDVVAGQIKTSRSSIDLPKLWQKEAQSDLERCELSPSPKDKLDQSSSTDSLNRRFLSYWHLRDPSKKYRKTPSFFKQTWYVIHRAYLMDTRRLLEIGIDLGMHFLAGLVIGFAFFTVPLYGGILKQMTMVDQLRPYIPTTCPFDRIPLFATFAIMGLSIAAVTASVRCFGTHRSVFYREMRAGMNLYAYYLGKCLYQIPIIVMHALMFVSILYLVTAPKGSFAIYFLIILMAEFCFYGLGYVISHVFPEANQSICGVVLALTWCITSGYAPSMMTVEQWGSIGSHLSVVKILWYLSFPFYIGEAFYTNEVNSVAYSSIFDIPLLNTQLWHYSIQGYVILKDTLFSLGIGFILRLFALLFLIVLVVPRGLRN